MATRRGPDNTVRFSISGLCNTVAFANVFWASLTVSGTPSQTDLDSWLTAAQNAYKTNFSPLFPSNNTYSQAQAILFLPAGAVLPSLVAMTGAGTMTGGFGTDQAASQVISWQTGVYWRGGKPRSYLPQPGTTGISNMRVLTPTQQSAVVSAANAYRTAINGLTAGAITGTQLGFVSFRTQNADRVPPVFYAYTGAKCHPRLGTQRRRLGKWQP